MRRLQEIVSSLYNKVKSKHEGSEDAPVGNDALAQLREIEHTLLFMYEEKDYIEKMALKSVSINRRHAEAEKAAEKARK